MANWDYDSAKFNELILYIVDRCADDPYFGDTHLNKVLFFSDAFALQHLGEPITGARYQKLEFGPAAVALLPARRELEAAHDVEVTMDGWRRMTRALRDPDTDLFTDDELELVDQVIELVKGKRAKTVSEESHLNSPGWNLVDENEDIPLESQLISREKPPSEVLERGRELAAKFGW